MQKRWFDWLIRLVQDLLIRLWAQVLRVQGYWRDWQVGLQVMKERLKEELSPFAPEPWRRG